MKNWCFFCVKKTGQENKGKKSKYILFINQKNMEYIGNFDFLLSFSKKTVIFMGEELSSTSLKEKFRKEKSDFTRTRKLTYEKMLILLLQKGVKSLQLRLNEFSLKLKNWEEVATAQAFSKAREKLKPEVFLNLNEEVIINRYYDLEENKAGYNTWNNFRILATDGSQIRLPDEKEIKDKYGTTKIKNRNGDYGEYTHGLLSVLHDPLNNLALDSILEKGNYSERALAIQNIQNLEKLKETNDNDLVIYDRGYFSLFLFAILLSYNKDFLCRLRKGICKEADELFEENCKINEKIVTLKVNNKEKEYKEKYGIEIDKELVKEVTIRLIRVVLDTGEIEVLATSLLDQEKYDIKEFKDLYYKRWGIEIFYDVIKNRLGLENFSGKTVHSVLQDLYSTILLSNFETVITRPNNYKLDEKTKKKNNKNKQKVNKQVSFNVIKNTLIELFLQKLPIDETMEKIMKLFEQNPTQVRDGRSSERKTTAYKSLNYHKRKKKHCF